MSDEERKIETLKKYINSQEQKMNDYYKIDEEFYKDEIEQLEFSIKLLRYILNLIEKKSKEIEELKEDRKSYAEEYIHNNPWLYKQLNEVYIFRTESKQKEKEAYNFGYRNGCNDTSKFNDKTFIRIDKLKEILGIEEENDTEEILSLLQTIVDENARLEDIEDKKVQIEYNDVFNKGVKSVEDKIKAKIEELEIEQESNREDLKIAIDNLLFQNIDKIGNRISINMSVREILQSLLEKE